MCGVSYGTVTSSIVFPISKMPNALKRSFYFKNQVSDAFKIHFEPMGRSSGKSLMEAQVQRTIKHSRLGFFRVVTSNKKSKLLSDMLRTCWSKGLV